MNESIATAVQALGALVSTLCLLAVVCVLSEVMKIVKRLRALMEAEEPAPKTKQAQPSAQNGPEPITELIPPVEASVPTLPVQVDGNFTSLEIPKCRTCSAKLKKIVNSILSDTGTTLVFKCGRCGKETSVSEELVPSSLLDPARSAP